MIRQGHIDRSQAIIILWFAMAAQVFLSFPAALLGETQTAGWLVIIGGGLVAAAAFIPAVLLARRFRDVSFVQAADQAGGLVLGKLFGFSITVLLLVIFALVLRQFGESFVIGILPATPIEVIVVTFGLIIGFSAYTGLESLGRVAVFLTPWLLIIFALILAGELVDVSLLRLFPLWGPGAAVLAGQAFLRSSFYAEIIILPILLPYLREKTEALPIGVWAISLAVLIMAGVQVVFVGSFDVPDSERFAFPILTLAREVGGGLVTRADPFFVFLWVFVAALKLSVTLWAVATALAETLRLREYRPLVAPLLTVGIAAALLPAGLQQATVVSFDLVRRWGWVVAFLFPATLWLLAIVRGKGGPATKEGRLEGGEGREQGG
jgi:spore germination protein (amino acid permease)